MLLQLQSVHKMSCLASGMEEKKKSHTKNGVLFSTTSIQVSMCSREGDFQIPGKIFEHLKVTLYLFLHCKLRVRAYDNLELS